MNFRSVTAWLVLAANVISVQTASAQTKAAGDLVRGAFENDNAWRTDRVTRLTKPDGWLSLIGLHFLKDGANTLGSAKDNDVVLSGGPAHLGVAIVGPAGKV